MGYNDITLVSLLTAEIDPANCLEHSWNVVLTISLVRSQVNFQDKLSLHSAQENLNEDNSVILEPKNQIIITNE